MFSGWHRALLLSLQLPEDTDAQVQDSLEELHLLVESLGCEVGDRIVQTRPQIHPATFFGKGKLGFIKDALHRLEFLESIGFVWDDYERRWEGVQKALTTYKELNGDLHVPQTFVVPASTMGGGAMGHEAGPDCEQHSLKRILSEGRGRARAAAVA